MTARDRGATTGRGGGGRMPAGRRRPVEAQDPVLADASPGFSRRQLLQAALVGAGAVALGGALAGCAPSSASSSGRTSVTVWDLFTGSDGANMQTMMGAVKKA